MKPIIKKKQVSKNIKEVIQGKIDAAVDEILGEYGIDDSAHLSVSDDISLAERKEMLADIITAIVKENQAA